MNKKRLITTILILCMTIALALAGCTVKKFAFTQDEIGVLLYESAEFSVNKVGEVTYEVADETIATIAEGKLVGLKVGTTTITATLGGSTCTATVNVTTATLENYAAQADVTAVSVNTEKSSTFRITATVLAQEVTPSRIFAAVGNPDVAEAEVSGNAITVKGLAQGNTSVTVTVWYQGASCEVTVPVTVVFGGEIAVADETVTLYLIDRDDYSTTYTLAPKLTVNGDEKDSAFAYESSRAAVATVDANGLITARRVGTTVITVSATYNGENVWKEVSVTVIKVTEKTTVQKVVYLGGEQSVLPLSDVVGSNDIIGLVDENGESICQVDQDGNPLRNEDGDILLDKTAIAIADATDFIKATVQTAAIDYEIAVYPVADVELSFGRVRLVTTVGETEIAPVYLNGVAIDPMLVSFQVADEGIATFAVTQDGLSYTGINLGSTTLVAALFGIETEQPLNVEAYETLQVSQNNANFLDYFEWETNQAMEGFTLGSVTPEGTNYDMIESISFDIKFDEDFGGTFEFVGESAQTKGRMVAFRFMNFDCVESASQNPWGPGYWWSNDVENYRYIGYGYQNNLTMPDSYSSGTDILYRFTHVADSIKIRVGGISFERNKDSKIQKDQWYTVTYYTNTDITDIENTRFLITGYTGSYQIRDMSFNKDITIPDDLPEGALYFPVGAGKILADPAISTSNASLTEKHYFSFSFYAMEELSRTSYLYMNIGGRQIYLNDKGIFLNSLNNDWQNDFGAFPDDAVRIYDQDGNLINNYMYNVNNRTFGPCDKTQTLVAGQWYTVVFNYRCAFEGIPGFNKYGGVVANAIGSRFILKDVELSVYGAPATLALDTQTLEIVQNQQSTIVATVANSDDTVVWTSSNEEIATVANGVVTAIAEGEVTITATLGNLTATCTVTVQPPVVVITVEEETRVVIGETKALNFSVVNNTGEITITSSNEGVLSVDAEGNLTGIQWGVATVTVTADGVSESCDVYVVTEDTIMMGVGDSSKEIIAPSVCTANASTSKHYASFEILFNGALSGSDYLYLLIGGRHLWLTDQGIYVHSLDGGWQSDYNNFSDDAVQIYDQDGNLINNNMYRDGRTFGPCDKTQGLVVGQWYTVVINYRCAFEGIPGFNKYGGISASCTGGSFNCTIRNIKTSVYGAPATLTLDTQSLELVQNQQRTIVATVANSDDTVVWTSSNEEIATVANGVVTAVGEGEVTITATLGNLTATCAVTVQPPQVTIVLDSETIRLKVGQTATLGYEVLNNVGDVSVSWTEQTVISINSENLITALALGRSEITVSVDGISAKCEVIVVSEADYDFTYGETLNGTVQKYASNRPNGDEHTTNIYTYTASSYTYGSEYVAFQVRFTTVPNYLVIFDMKAPIIVDTPSWGPDAIGSAAVFSANGVSAVKGYQWDASSYYIAPMMAEDTLRIYRDGEFIPWSEINFEANVTYDFVMKLNANTSVCFMVQDEMPEEGGISLFWGADSLGKDLTNYGEIINFKQAKKN